MTHKTARVTLITNCISKDKADLLSDVMISLYMPVLCTRPYFLCFFFYKDENRMMYSGIFPKISICTAITLRLLKFSCCGLV